MGEVSVIGCKSYDIDEVNKAIDKLFKNLGGIENIVNKGDKVFLKLNLIAKKRPELAVTTHPIVVETVAKKLVNFGCKVIIGDSPGGPYSERVLKGIYEVCGIEEAAKNSGAELNYDTSLNNVENNDNIKVKRLILIKPPFDCDRVISIAKLKTHGMTTMTGAVKVMYGMVPGLTKAEYHFKMQDIYDFSDLLIDIVETVNPSLSIIDGILGMEGDGPTAGEPVESKVLLASKNPYDLDVVSAHIMGINPSIVPTIKRSIDRGLTAGDINKIGIIGDKLDKFIIKYKVPVLKNINFFRGRVPNGIEKFLTMYISPRPVFVYNKCIGCGFCRDNCPAKAIKIRDNKPEISQKDCIMCYCCQELCPRGAVLIKRNWLHRLIFRH